MVWLQEADRTRYNISFEIAEPPPPVVPLSVEQQQANTIAEQASRIAELQKLVETQQSSINRLQHNQRSPTQSDVVGALPAAPAPAVPAPAASKPIVLPKPPAKKRIVAGPVTIAQVFYDQFLKQRTKVWRRNLWFFGKPTKPVAQR